MAIINLDGHIHSPSIITVSDKHGFEWIPFGEFNIPAQTPGNAIIYRDNPDIYGLLIRSYIEIIESRLNQNKPIYKIGDETFESKQILEYWLCEYKSAMIFLTKHNLLV